MIHAVKSEYRRMLKDFTVELVVTAWCGARNPALVTDNPKCADCPACAEAR